MRVDIPVVHVHDVHVIVLHEVALVSVALVRVQVHDHGLARLALSVGVEEEVLDGERDVGVSAEAAATSGTAVMEAAADVDGPAALHGDVGRLKMG